MNGIIVFSVMIVAYIWVANDISLHFVRNVATCCQKTLVFKIIIDFEFLRVVRTEVNGGNTNGAKLKIDSNSRNRNAI